MPKLDLSNVEKLIAEANVRVPKSLAEYERREKARHELADLAPNLAAEVLRLSKEVGELREKLRLKIVPADPIVLEDNQP